VIHSPLSSSGDLVHEVVIQHCLFGDNAGFIVKTGLRLPLTLFGALDKIHKTASSTTSFPGKEATSISLLLTGYEYGSEDIKSATNKGIRIK
jgi:hypothetical protein